MISILLAAVAFASPFGDGCVLQRDRPVNVWGTAEPGEDVRVLFAGNEVSARTGADGRWIAVLPPMPACNEGRVLSANGAVIKDVLVGEVWLAAGQSNMAFSLYSGNPRSSDRNAGLVAQLTCRDNLRLARVQHRKANSPRVDGKLTWRKAVPDTLLKTGAFSAVGFYFGKTLEETLGVPVGVIETAVGATSIDSWIPKQEFAAFKPSKRPGNEPQIYYNGMVAQLVPYTFRGLIWYQGERNSDVIEYPQYATKLHAFLNGWRRVFGNPEMTMRLVQLAPWGRETVPQTQCQQARFVKEESATKMCVVNDVANLHDIHPNEKETVGRRLAALALKHDYGLDIVADSPEVSAWQADGDKARLKVTCAKRLHLYHPDWMYRGDAKRTVELGFELAGADGAWKPAEILNLKKTVTGRDSLTGKAVGEYRGEFEGTEIVLRADGVIAPVGVRYLFTSPWRGSVYNEAGLPMGAFSFGFSENCRVVTDLSGEGWMLKDADGSVREVAVPHSWNIEDGCDGREVLSTERYRKNSSCMNSYERKRVVYSHPLPGAKSGRRYFVRCEGASITAKVSVNGREAGSHLGAFTAFCFEVTKLMKPSGNTLEIAVDNFSRDDVAPPVNADFTMYGGLYRGVSLIETPEVCIDSVTDGASGVRIETDPDTGVVRAKLKVLGGADETREFKIEGFRLWSPETPVVYTQRFEIASGDAVVETFGFRKAEFHPDGFYLNGKRRFIRGVNYHQDREGRGWAVSKGEIAEDISLIRELGADGVRTAHYPHSSYTYSQCDERGLLVWCEHPNVNGLRFNDEFRTNCWRQVREMVAQLGNHPSIICWSIFNELYNKVQMKDGDPEAMMEELRDYVKTLDPSRPIAAASDRPAKRRLNAVPEVLGFNRYPGWYGDAVMPRLINEICDLNGRTSFGMTEFGAGASINQHGDPLAVCAPDSSWHTEEYQASVNADSYRAIQADPRLWGAFVWCMFDFGSDRRLEGEIWGRNDKGLMTFDHRVRKDAWHFYNINWTEEPKLHLVGSRFDIGTTNATFNVMGFSSAGEVTLKVNGRVIGTMTPDVVRTVLWKSVPLDIGRNVVELSAGGLVARGVWKRTKALNYDAASVGDAVPQNPLVDMKGNLVSSAAEWRDRRTEILEMFQREMYGRIPAPIAPVLDVVDEGVTMGGYAIRRQVKMYFREDHTGPCINWLLLLPRHVKQAVPALMFLNYGGNHELLDDSSILIPKCWMRPAPGFKRYGERATAATRGLYADHNLRTVYPVGMILARGFAVVTACYSEISPDWHGRKLDGKYRDDDVLSLFPFDSSREDNTTALGAWAWGLMRGMDMVMADKAIDSSRVTVLGSSRLAKAALIAGAFDERFYAVVPNQTGGGGSPLLRRNYGENAESLLRHFPHWFCRAFDKYSANEKAMPFDSHMLMACIAPRKLLIEGFDDPFYDTEGEFMAVRMASPVWKLLGGVGLPDVPFPEDYSTSAIGTDLGYVRRTEQHGISAYDWTWIMDFSLR